jgi:hypothetical protein
MASNLVDLLSSDRGSLVFRGMVFFPQHYENSATIPHPVLQGLRLFESSDVSFTCVYLGFFSSVESYVMQKVKLEMITSNGFGFTLSFIIPLYYWYLYQFFL